MSNFPFSSPKPTHTESMGLNVSPKKSVKKLVKNNFTRAKKKTTVPDQKKVQTPGLNAPEISTEKFRKMTVSELRKFTLDYYNENLKGRKVAFNKVLKSVEFVANGGKKLHTPMYSAKASVIEHLEELIKNSTYNNWGERKPKDSQDVLGYLNFKSKITIDGEKRHVRISVILNDKRETKLKGFEVGAKQNEDKKSDNFNKAHRSNSLDGMKKPLSKNKDTKKGLNCPNPIKKPIAMPKPIQNMQSKKALNDLEKMGFVSADSAPKEASGVYTLGGEIGKFLQKQQPHKSLILIKGNKHSSKSQLAMQIANSYAENNEPVAYIDYEQGGIDSKDTVDSINRNTSEAGRKNISIIGYLEKPFEELQKFCKVCKVIVADSVTDLKITADQLNELRNKHPKITWVFISQVKENGAMYGGNKMAHNPTVVIDCSSDNDPKNRIATLEKNRGNDLELKYSMFYKKVIVDGKNKQRPGTAVQQKTKKLSFKVK